MLPSNFKVFCQGLVHRPELQKHSKSPFGPPPSNFQERVFAAYKCIIKYAYNTKIKTFSEVDHAAKR